jgi:hypothetical protein
MYPNLDLELETLKEIMAREFRENQETMDLRFEMRESRKEDVEFIREVEHRLAEKEREANQLYHNLKYFQLERENNDKLYTRIFTSSREKVLFRRSRREPPSDPTRISTPS